MSKNGHARRTENPTHRRQGRDTVVRREANLKPSPLNNMYNYILVHIWPVKFSEYSAPLRHLISVNAGTNPDGRTECRARHVPRGHQPRAESIAGMPQLCENGSL